MKNIKVKEAEIRWMKIFCAVLALTGCAFSVLYLLNVVQNHWLLNFIQVLGVLIHISLALLAFVKNHRITALIMTAIAIAYLAGLIVYLY